MMSELQETRRPTILNPPGVAAPESHYSHVAVSGDHVHVAGQIGVRPDGGIAGTNSVGDQTRQAYENVRVVLEHVGSSMLHVVRFVTYLVNRSDIPAMRDIRTELFERTYVDGAYPTHTLLVVEALASPEYLIEIEATAVLGPV